MEREIDYPAEMTFKSVFKNSGVVMDRIQKILDDECSGALLYGRESKNGKFISFTVTAVFNSDIHLNTICGKISSLEGFMMMF